MEPYQVLEQLLGFMQTYRPSSPLMRRAVNMLVAKKLPPVEEVQLLVTDIQVELDNLAPSNQYFGVRNGIIGFWPHLPN